SSGLVAATRRTLPLPFRYTRATGSRFATARLLASVGHVDASPKKRPKSSYIPFVRATAMSLGQLDTFQYDLSDGDNLSAARWRVRTRTDFTPSVAESRIPRT